jgi:hypothetical protein
MRFIVISLVLLFTGHIHAQDIEKTKHVDFAVFLIEEHQTEELSVFYQEMLSTPTGSSEMDSIHFLYGFMNYQEGYYDLAAQVFTRVSENSPFFYKSLFYRTLSQIQAGHPDSAYVTLQKISPDTTNHHLFQLWIYGKAATAILLNDTALFKVNARLFSAQDSVLKKEQNYLQENFFKMQHRRKKSPFLAGLFSGILPGSGKVYAGNNGQAISGFLRVSLLGLMASESFLKHGPVNPQFITLGVAFLIFYTGNIWGSALAPHTLTHELNHEIHHNVTISLSDTFRYFFN